MTRLTSPLRPAVLAAVLVLSGCAGSTGVDPLAGSSTSATATTAETTTQSNNSSTQTPNQVSTAGTTPAASTFDADRLIGDVVPWQTSFGDEALETVITDVSCGLEVVGRDTVAQGEFCVVSLTVTQVAGDGIGLFTASEVELITDQRTYQSEADLVIALTSNVYIGSYLLENGESTDERLVFDVREGDTVVGVKLPQDMGTVGLVAPVTTTVGQSAEAQLTAASTLSDDVIIAFDAFVSGGDSLWPEDFGQHPLPGCRDLDIDVIGSAMGVAFDRKGGRETPGVSPHRGCALYDGTNEDTWDNLVRFDIAPVDQADQYMFTLGSDDDLFELPQLGSQAWWGPEGSVVGGYSVLKVIDGDFQFLLRGRTNDYRGMTPEQMLAGMQAILAEMDNYAIPDGDGIIDSCADLPSVDLGDATIDDFTPTRFDNSLACFAETPAGDRIHITVADWDRSPFHLEGVLEDLRPFDGTDPVIDVVSEIAGLDQAWRLDDNPISHALTEDIIGSDEVFGLLGTQFANVSIAGPIAESGNNEALLLKVLGEVLLS